MESQVSVFEFHGESSNQGDYQHPRPANEPIYNNCGGIDGGNDGASGLQEHGWRSECDASTGIGSYQHPRPEPTAFEPELYENQQEISRKDQVSSPENYQEPKPTYNGCTQDSRSPLPSRPKVALTKPPRYTKPQSKSREPKGPPHYQTPSLPHPTHRTTDQTPASKSSQPPSDYNQPKEYTNVSSENAKNLGDCEATEFVPSIEMIPTVTSISKTSSPKMSQNQSNQQFQEMDIKFPESKNIQGEPTAAIITAPSLCREEMNRVSNYQLPEIDFEFLQSKDKTSCSSSSPPTPQPSANIAPPSSLPSALPSRAPSPGIPTARSTVVRGSSPPDSPSEPLPAKSPVIPPCLPTKPVGPPIPPKMKSIDSQVPPPLPSKTPPPNSPEISLQSTACSQQISLQATPPSFPSNTTPSPPSSGTTKPSSSLYAELNELDRRDDTEDYQHLTSMTKQ
ncbi:vegetative cell wall protein gp1-like [Dendronephthya gigantea]|uniref:vegetative cell wall protein gp1-like n=1 Tax=Dendronephthya gigantea TaxID=151771 RepID=UPI00106A496F|nr:vegetative cell wall protein gp1-like [Dendronephthya gigantea]